MSQCHYFTDSATQFESRPCSASMWALTGSLVVLTRRRPIAYQSSVYGFIPHFRNVRVSGNLGTFLPQLVSNMAAIGPQYQKSFCCVLHVGRFAVGKDEKHC